MRLIDADALSERMYHDAFETDSDMQKWEEGCWIRYKMFERAIEDAPTVQPTLYGYRIAHLAYIATVMEKEGVTAEYVAGTLDNISQALKMILEEAQEKIFKTMNERFDIID